MSAAPRVWKAAPDEAGVVTALLAGFRDHMGGDWPPDDSILASVQRLIDRPDAEYILAAPGPDAPAAGVVQVRYRWSVWWDADDCWVEDVFVRDDARGAGLGRALMDVVLERARARGCRRVELDVNDGNPAALALYESLGFRTGKIGGRDLLMRLRL
jgi:ribosomal protein S18 acetylase RimI-like enzyme